MPNNVDAAPDGRGHQESATMSRRALLRWTGLVAGSVGAGTILAACVPATAGGSWTYPPPTQAPIGSGSVESGMAGMSMEPDPSPASAGPAPSALALTGARDPSPADFAIPPAFHAAGSAPVVFELTSNDGPDETILISASPATAYRSMNFGRQVPAPTLRITEGETVHFTLTNQGQMPHSIDFHAAQVAWSKNYQEIAPGHRSPSTGPQPIPGCSCTTAVPRRF